MLGAKPPNNDANGLFRATHSHNPTRYSHIIKKAPPHVILTQDDAFDNIRSVIIFSDQVSRSEHGISRYLLS